jgi:hypothetical protein
MHWPNCIFWGNLTRFSLQLARLIAYRQEHGHCNVPARCVKHPQLSSWVRMQRRHKKAMVRGTPGEGMTADRVARLQAP